MGKIPPLIGNPYFMRIHQPLRTWVAEFYPLLYGNNGSLDPGTCVIAIQIFCLQIPPPTKPTQKTTTLTLNNDGRRFKKLRHF